MGDWEGCRAVKKQVRQGRTRVACDGHEGVVWVLEGGDDDLHTPLRVANWFLWTGLGSASVLVGLMAEE